MPATLFAKVTEKLNLSKDYWLIKLRFDSDFSFLAGQYVSVKVAVDGTRRSYSVSSAPKGNEIELLVDVAPMGVGSKYFLSLSVGDSVEMMGPMGVFTVGGSKPKKMFIATGSGIAPMRSMIVDLLENQKDDNEISLIWGMRYEEDLFWIEEFNQLKARYSNFNYEVVLSKPGEHWHGKCGHVGDCLREGFIVTQTDLSVWDFYLCGSQEMIKETGGYLAGKGIVREAIHYEKFF